MKRQIIITVIVTAIICIAGTSYAAYKLRASEVSFDKSNTELNSDTVQDGIDELADLLKYGTATANDIKKGKTALVNGEKITGAMENSNEFKTITVEVPASSKATSWQQTVTLPKEGLELGKTCFVVCTNYGSVDSSVNLSYSISGTTLTISGTMSDRAFYWCNFVVYYI